MAKFNNLFPLWAVLLSSVAFVFSGLFGNFEQAIVPLLTAVMFIMGLTLTYEDFLRISKDPRPVFVGVLLQFFLNANSGIDPRDNAAIIQSANCGHGIGGKLCWRHGIQRY